MRFVAAFLLAFACTVVLGQDQPVECPNGQCNIEAEVVCEGDAMGSVIYQIARGTTVALMKDNDKLADEIGKTGNELQKRGVGNLQPLQKRFLELARDNNMSQRFLGRGDLEAEVSQGDSDYLDATKSVLIAYRLALKTNGGLHQLAVDLAQLAPPETPADGTE